MNRDPFLRFALIALCTAGVYTLSRLGWAWAAGLLVFGIVFAMFLTVERTPPPSRDELKEQLRPRRRVDSEGKPDFERIAS